jgi:hypothetical protein
MAAVATPVLAAPAPPRDATADRSKPDSRRFAMLVTPLSLLLVVFRVYNLEQPPFFTLACIVFGGFAISYWLPFHLKQPFLTALSLGGAYVLLTAAVATLVIAAGLVMFAVIRSPLGFGARVTILLTILAACIYGRATGRFPVPGDFWPVLGAIFMFRMMIYLYDLKHTPGPANLKDYLSYFFLLPNYYFLLFPVVDHQVFRNSYYKRDINVVAQQGIWWILRGTTHLLFYRVIYQLSDNFSPPGVSVPLAVAVKIVACYLLYLRVSGQFHIIAGMLCLFGYDLPETNHRYFLAHSVNDMWRRINIYWKDFMVKMVYFPTYFKLRRKGALQAELVGTVLVVVVTYILHAYQFFWIRGQFRLSISDALFWVVLGSAMLGNVLIENRNKLRPQPTVWGGRLQNAVQVVVTFCFMAVLWSMWSADSLTEWLYFLKTGNI